ncbi:MAG: serine/threonine protein kinase [Blastocatellia bacterium]|nr:serine/threonine protein kinase [Blastocatellia bacterium]
MTHCPSCNSAVAAHALACPQCGAALDDTSSPTAMLPDEPAARVAEASADGARFAAGTMLTERYRIVSLLGRGGMGEVYKAEDLKLKQVVALKFLPEALALDGAALARFHNEVRITRQISHPNVCRVYDIGEVAGQHFLSMEFIDGEDLSVLLRRIGRLPGDKATEITRQICAGLAAAHENGVLHRDLKPANIMIDGRGKARVTDFGVAVVANELLGREAAAGTPGYMAPEQLAGKEVTQRSDIYSLGLVLYELFTGKRVFEAKSLHELMQLHEKSTPPTPSSYVKDIDPLAERVILRCLEKDPQKRPASAIQVAAALPGGDPLAAALAAGETPSPEMVAAAGEKTGLRPAVAIACLVAVMVGLIILALLGNKMGWQAQVLRKNSPEVLAHKARDIINRLGYTDPPADSAFGIDYNYDYLSYVDEKDTSGNRQSQVTKGQPAAIRFWYRESPRRLVPVDLRGRGLLREDDPPQDISGMVNVSLDPAGRLIAFTAVPPQRDEARDAPPTPDWAALFAVAGLDPKRFTPTEPQWTPLLAYDARTAWTGTYPDRPEIPLRIEAAAYRGKTVFFTLVGPWTKPYRMQESQPTTRQRIQNAIALCLFLGLMLGAVLLARYNFRQGRGDRRGAFRLALFVFVANLLSWMIFYRHTLDISEVETFFFLFISRSLMIAGILWLLYLALEPYVRRRWPDTLISWSRVLSGSLRDPLVGRDLLVGVLFSIGWLLLSQCRSLVLIWRGWAPWGGRLETLSGLRDLIAIGFLDNLTREIFFALFFFFLLFLLRALTRRQWLAASIWVLINFVPGSLTENDPLIAALFGCLAFTLTVLILLRFGLVTTITGFFLSDVLGSVPLTTDFSAWYGGYTLAALLAVLALAGYAFHTSLGGQKLFTGKLLEE